MISYQILVEQEIENLFDYDDLETNLVVGAKNNSYKLLWSCIFFSLTKIINLVDFQI